MQDDSDREQLLGSAVGSLQGGPPPARSDGYSFWARWVGFFILGTVNNLPYVIVGSAAKAIAGHYCALNLIGAVTWANVAMGFVAKGCNATFLLSTPYTFRLWGMVAVMSAGLIVLALSESFAVAIVGIVLAGAACSFGEGVVLGYLNLFDTRLVNAWSSGTGMAGVGGSLLYLLYVGVLDLDFRSTFLYTIPWMGLYLLAYHALVGPSTTDATRVALAKPLLGGTRDREGFCARVLRCTRYCGWVTLNLCLVYIFEYVISGGLAAKVLPDALACTFDTKATCKLDAVDCLWSVVNDTASPSQQQCAAGASKGQCTAPTFERQHAFAIFALCYQAGVLISRSSLQLIQIERVEILTFLQLLNAVAWTLQANFKLTDSLYLLFAMMFFVGLLGGASYVNVFHLLLTDQRIPGHDREFTIQLAALLGPTLGITLSSVSILLMDNTFLKDK